MEGTAVSGALIKRVVPHGDIYGVITNRPTETLNLTDFQDANVHHWQIEELHCYLKQRTCSERCQARSAHSQRNHLHYCYHA